MTRPLPPGLVDRDALEFAGRHSELETLSATWKEVGVLGARRVVALGGDAGIGKTRLLSELAADAQASGAGVVLGRSDQDAFVPHQPVAEIMGQLATWATTDANVADAIDRHREPLSWLVPHLGAGSAERGEGDERTRLVAACSAVLRAAAESGPLLVVVDDVHWAPPPTLGLVRHLLRAAEGGRPVLLALAYRHDEAGPATPLGMLLADLRREPDVVRLALDGLDVDTVGDLIARARATTADRPTADAVHAATGGNPFLVGELVRHLDDPEGPRSLPEGALLVLEHRLAQLPEATRNALGVAAVIGTEFDLDTLQAVGAAGGDDLVDALEIAVQRRVLREVEGGWARFRFTHALAQDAVLAGLGPTRLARLHQQIGEAIAATANGSLAVRARAAHHLVQSARPEVVLRGAREALAVCESTTYSTESGDGAALALRAANALEALPGHDAELLVDLLAAAANAYVNEMRLPEFSATSTRAVAAARRAGTPRALAVAAAARGWYNPTGDADHSILDDALEALDVIDPSEELLRGRLHAGVTSAIGNAVGDHSTGMVHALEAVRLADRAGPLRDRWMARFAQAQMRAGEADVGPLRTLGLETEAMGVAHGDESVVAHGRRMIALADLQEGDLDSFATTIAACAEVWQAYGYTLGIAQGIHARILEAAARGRLDEAEATTAEILDRLPNDRYHSATYAAQLIVIRWLQGRLGELEAMVGMAAAAYPELPSLHTCHGLALMELGRVDEARAVCRARPDDPRMFGVDFLLPTRLAWGIELAILTGELDQLPRLVEAFEPYGGQLVLLGTGVGVLGAADHFLGAAAAAQGDDATAATRFAAALDLEERQRLAPLAARTKAWMARRHG
jgi:hypothetical protein